jgi:hypothetical protein
MSEAAIKHAIRVRMEAPQLHVARLSAGRNACRKRHGTDEMERGNNVQTWQAPLVRLNLTARGLFTKMNFVKTGYDSINSSTDDQPTRPKKRVLKRDGAI